jgi:dihydroorotate dehydrogenase (fumarate)
VESIKELAAAGAGAVVLKSLFEEQIMHNINPDQDFDNEMGFYLNNNAVQDYLDLIKNAKAAVDIPVIASINCYDDNEWIDFAAKMQEAGADALEINMFVMPADMNMTSEDLEANYISIVNKLLTAVDIPVSVKLSSYFSGLANFMQAISKEGANGLVLFNKFYVPKVDIENEELIAGPTKSTSLDNANTLRWMGILSGKVEADLSASTGIHTAEDVISNLLVGATTTQMVSAIMTHGSEHITKVLKDIEDWMNKKGYASVDDFRANLSQKNVSNPVMFERVQFMKYFQDA